LIEYLGELHRAASQLEVEDDYAKRYLGWVVELDVGPALASARLVFLLFFSA
jgi:hypothetical protein